MGLLQTTLAADIKETCGIAYEMATADVVNAFDSVSSDTVSSDGMDVFDLVSIDDMNIIDLTSFSHYDINTICRSLPSIDNSNINTLFSVKEGKIRYTREGLVLRSLLRDVCIPMTPKNLSSDEKIQLLSHTFWDC